MFRKRIFLLFTIIFLLFSSFSSFSQEPQDISLKKSFSSLLSEFSKSLGKEIEPAYFEKHLGLLPAGIIYEPQVGDILDLFRKKGIFLHAFKVKPDKNTLTLLRENGYPFITYLEKKGYVLVKDISEEKIFLVSGRKEFFLREDEFLELWSGYIFSLPLVNIMAERVRDDKPKNGRFIIAYSYHKENFDKLKPILDKLQEEANLSGRKFIYIDELGLIPRESIKKIQKIYKITEKEAFERARKDLAEEIERFSRGISTYDENPFYQAQYSYLARHKILSYMEELDYDNWRRIVRFDDFNLHNKAVNAFCRGNIKAYLKKLREYNHGFWIYNVKERDDNFRQQIKKIAQNNPSSIIFTLRGIGHYGLEEKLELEDFSIETYIITERGFAESLVSDQLAQVMVSNGVELSKEEENLLYLRSFPEECLRTYFQKKIEDLTIATSRAKKIVEKLSQKEIKKLSRDIAYAFAKGKIVRSEDVWEYVYNWFKERNKISPEINNN
ncbi:MAG: hypothetical protein AB7E08_03815 [Candidatus Omnitrophota bacterium]